MFSRKKTSKNTQAKEAAVTPKKPIAEAQRVNTFADVLQPMT